MARPKDEDRRNAILAAATKVIADRGLNASTAMIAQSADISNGSLFTYFETKTDLFNQLYLELKSQMASAAQEGLAAQTEPRERLFLAWSNWVTWAASHPHKRRALAQLTASGEITQTSRDTANRGMAGIGELVERIRLNGSLRDAPRSFVALLMNALADSTTESMILDPPNAKTLCGLGFDALWRVLA